MSNLEKVLNLFRKKKYLIRMGAGNISKRYNIPIEDINEARRIYHKEKQRNKQFNILSFDIETTPSKAFVYQMWKTNVRDHQIISEWFMLCYAAKWFGSKEVISDSVTPEEVLKEDDSRISKSLWTLIDQADIVIAHNGKSFDVKKMNTRFFMAGLPQPSPYLIIDTLLVARQQFSHNHNGLDALAKKFGIEGKDDTSFQLWVDCLKGDQKSLDYMEKYCRNDVRILEKVYIKLRPWIKNHPNIGLYIEADNMVCPTCGSKHLVKDNTFHYTKVSKFEIMRCTDCESISRLRTSSYPVKKRNNLITSL